MRETGQTSRSGRRGRGAGRQVFAAAFAIAVALLLFGNYLGLSVSQVLTGSAGNWILFTGMLQFAVLALALLLGRLIVVPPLAFVAGYAGLCCIMLGHAAVEQLHGHQLTDYGNQKVQAAVLLLGPALWCGIVLGRHRQLPGTQLLPFVLAPLLALCGIALATDPHLLTIANYDKLAVYGGVLVLPAHQGLASCLAAAALASLALAPGGSRWQRVGSLGLCSVLFGLVLLSGARGYAVATIAGLATQLLFGGRRLGLALLSAAAALLLFQAFAPELVQERLQVDGAMESLAYREREVAWQTAWLAFVDHPLLGAGPGGFARAIGYQGRSYPHNLVLELASEFGAVGLCCFGAMLLPLFANLLRLLRRRERPGPVATFAVGYLVFGLIGSMTVGDLIRNHFVFLALGMATAATLRPSRQRRRAAAAAHPQRPALQGATA